MIKSLTLTAVLMCLAWILISTAHAQAPGDPLATADAAARDAQAAQWRANAARSTADAAYAQATAQAQEATRQAEALATAQAQQATATAAQATAQSQATRQAVEMEATRAAISAQATADAHAYHVEATRAAAAYEATATRAAALAEQDRLTLDRARRLQPLYTYGPWIVAVALGLALGALGYLALREYRRTSTGDDDCWPRDAEHNGTVQNAIIIEAQPSRATRCLLRPIDPHKSRRPIDV